MKIYQRYGSKNSIYYTVLHEPKVLILDEPLSGLDPVNSLMIKNEILELKKKTSIILSTHDMNSVEEICDEAAIINHSEKIMQGNQELKEKYQENSWNIQYRGNQMSFTNAVWGGWEIINHEKLMKILIKLKSDYSINLPLINLSKG